MMTRRARLRRGARAFAAVVALALGVSLGVLAGPSPAVATIPKPPPGGWCYQNWYNHQADNGSSIQRYGSIKRYQNQSNVPAQWTETVQVQHTFRTTYQSTTRFEGGFDFGIVKVTTERRLQITIVTSKTVTETSSTTVTVPAHTTMNLEYGAWQRKTSGTFHQERYECGTADRGPVTSGSVTGRSLTGAVGWRQWQS